MRGIAVGKAPLDAAVATIGLAVFVGHHAHQFVTAHLGLEAATDATIGAGGDHRMRWRADLDDRFFLQGRGRTSGHAGPARHAIRGEGVVGLGTKRHAAVKSATLDGQREGALHLLAGTHAAAAHDTFLRVIAEIGVAVVAGDVVRVFLATCVFHPEMRINCLIPHVAQADSARHVLQFAIAIGAASQAIQRVIADVQFHHATAQLLQSGVLGMNFQARSNRGGATGGCAIAPLDLDQTQTAGSEGVDAVRRAKFRHLNARFGRRAHDAGALGHGHRKAVDGQCDHLF